MKHLRTPFAVMAVGLIAMFQLTWLVDFIGRGLALNLGTLIWISYFWALKQPWINVE